MTTQNPYPVDVGHQLPAPHDSALRHKVENLKSRGIAAVDLAKRRAAAQVTRTSDSVQQSMRSKPMMWAGVAGGTGMVLGLIGRLIQWRAHRRMHRRMPDLVIIDAAC